MHRTVGKGRGEFCIEGKVGKMMFFSHDFSAIGPGNVKEILSQTVFHDLWGYPVNWKDSSQGWNETYRKMMVLIHNDIVEQRGKKKTVTKTGYQTLKIPPSAHKALVETRNMRPKTPVYCGDR